MYCSIWNFTQVAISFSEAPKHNNREYMNMGSCVFVHMALARRLLCGYFDKTHDVNIVSCVLETFGWQCKSRMQTWYSYIYVFYMHVARNSFHLWNPQMVTWISKCHHSPNPQIGVVINGWNIIFLGEWYFRRCRDPVIIINVLCYMRFSLRLLHTGCLENYLGVAFLFVGFVEISNFVIVRTLLIAYSMNL